MAHEAQSSEASTPVRHRLQVRSRRDPRRGDLRHARRQPDLNILPTSTITDTYCQMLRLPRSAATRSRRFSRGSSSVVLAARPHLRAPPPRPPHARRRERGVQDQRAPVDQLPAHARERQRAAVARSPRATTSPAVPAVCAPCRRRGGRLARSEGPRAPRAVRLRPTPKWRTTRIAGSLAAVVAAAVAVSGAGRRRCIVCCRCVRTSATSLIQRRARSVAAPRRGRRRGRRSRLPSSTAALMRSPAPRSTYLPTRATRRRSVPLPGREALHRFVMSYQSAMIEEIKDQQAQEAQGQDAQADGDAPVRSPEAPLGDKSGSSSAPSSFGLLQGGIFWPKR